MTQPFRTASGGLVDRGTTLTFTFDGRRFDCGSKLGFIEATLRLQNRAEICMGFEGFRMDPQCLSKGGFRGVDFPQRLLHIPQGHGSAGLEQGTSLQHAGLL